MSLMLLLETKKKNLGLLPTTLAILNKLKRRNGRPSGRLLIVANRYIYRV